MKDYLKYSNYKGKTVIEILCNELDLNKVTKLSPSNDLELKRLNYPSVIIDISKVNHIDTSGLGFIANMNKMLSGYGSEVAVICRSDEILRLIFLTKLDSFVKIFSNLDEAAEYFDNKKTPAASCRC